jgi:hypothetical protein
VLKKAGVAVGIAAAALMVLTPLAFADGHDGHDGHYGGNGEHFQFLPGVDGKVFQHPISSCGEKHFESHRHNTDSHDGDCDQDVSPSDD